MFNFTIRLEDLRTGENLRTDVFEWLMIQSSEKREVHLEPGAFTIKGIDKKAIEGIIAFTLDKWGISLPARGRVTAVAFE